MATVCVRTRPARMGTRLRYACRGRVGRCLGMRNRHSPDLASGRCLDLRTRARTASSGRFLGWPVLAGHIWVVLPAWLSLIGFLALVQACATGLSERLAFRLLRPRSLRSTRLVFARIAILALALFLVGKEWGWRQVPEDRLFWLMMGGSFSCWSACSFGRPKARSGFAVIVGRREPLQPHQCRLKRRELVGFMGWLVPADPMNARKPHGDPGFMAC